MGIMTNFTGKKIFKELPMEATKHKEIQRTQGIGGSDVAALLGMSPYKTPVELWAEKVGHPSSIQREGLHLRFGQHLEPFIAKEFENQTDLVTQEHSNALLHPEHTFMYAHIDRFVVHEAWQPAVVDGIVVADELLECKTASVYNKDEWGPSGTDQVPRAYLLQCIWYMAITGCTKAHIAALIGNSDFRVYQIPRDKKLEQLVLDHAKRFWFDHVLEGVAPKPRSTSDVKLLHPCEVADQSVEATPELFETVKQLKQLQDDSKALEEKTDALKTQIMHAMGNAQELSLAGKLLATWKSSKPVMRLDTNSLKKHFPEAATQCMVTGQAQRRFVIKDFK
jgi:putative phage-type endonuclease